MTTTKDQAARDLAQEILAIAPNASLMMWEDSDFQEAVGIYDAVTGPAFTGLFQADGDDVDLTARETKALQKIVTRYAPMLNWGSIELEGSHGHFSVLEARDFWFYEGDRHSNFEYLWE